MLDLAPPGKVPAAEEAFRAEMQPAHLGSPLERNAPYWRMKADEARRRATGMHDESAKETMLDIANRYDAMAQQAEGREVRARTKTKKPNASN